MTNKEAIDRLNGMQSRCDNGYDAEAIYLAIKALEERPTGKWISDGFCFSSSKFKCSRCHFPELEKTNYCPNCGARMKEAEND